MPLAAPVITTTLPSSPQSIAIPSSGFDRHHSGDTLSRRGASVAFGARTRDAYFAPWHYGKGCGKPWR
jgi:hypothetical protein